MLAKERQQVRGLHFLQPARAPAALKIIGSMKQHVIPPALVINQKIRHPILEQFIAMLFAPRCFRILIALSEAHN
jgi:hypothetical protein